MDFKKLLSRVAAVTAAIATPTIAAAAIGDNVDNGDVNTDGATATIQLQASVNGIIRLRIWERVLNEANRQTPSVGNLAEPTDTDAGATGIQPSLTEVPTTNFDSVDFGTVTTNPTGTTTTGNGYHLNTAEGALFIARLNAGVYFSGAPNAKLQIDGTLATVGGATEPYVPAAASRGADATFDYWTGYNCAATDGASVLGTPESLYSGGTVGGATNFAALTDAHASVGWADCADYSEAGNSNVTQAGYWHTRNVDLALYLDDSAPNGNYSEDFDFRAYIYN